MQSIPARPGAPRRPYALRYSVRHRDGRVLGTVSVHLQRLPDGKAPVDVARQLLTINGYPNAEPILPRAVLLDDDAAPVGLPPAPRAAAAPREAVQR